CRGAGSADRADSDAAWRASGEYVRARPDPGAGRCPSERDRSAGAGSSQGRSGPHRIAARRSLDTNQPRPLALSQRLAQIVDEDGPDRLSFSDLALQLQARAWGGLLAIFATINAIPLPPGVNIFFA